MLLSAKCMIGTVCLLLIGCTQAPPKEEAVLIDPVQVQAALAEAQALSAEDLSAFLGGADLSEASLARLRQARELTEAVAAGAPSEGNPQVLLGLLNRALGEPERAEEYLRQALLVLPETEAATRGEAHTNLSRILFDRADYSAAEAEVRKALEYRPTNPDDWAQLASVQVQLNKLEEAGQSVSKALEFAPDHPRALQLKGLLEMAAD